ncbi:MAG: dockerin type I repeat-containing protein [Planctomycetes bacterium]|nr:dockerin type I repeat-containing protein [Planctomycetota bacterium]
MNSITSWTRVALSIAVLLGVSSAIKAQPVHDDCDGALVVGPGVHAFDTAGATASDVDPPGFAQDLWYRTSAPHGITVRIRVCGPFDLTPVGLLVYAGDTCPPPITSLLGTGGECDWGFASAFELDVQGPTLLTLRVGSLAGPIEGQLRITWIEHDCHSAPTTAVIPPLFRRGDADGDGTVDVGDVIYLASSIVEVGAPPLPCRDAADANDDGRLDLADPVRLAFALFQPSTASLPPPGPLDCGTDPSTDTIGDDLGCATVPPCP